MKTGTGGVFHNSHARVRCLLWPLALVARTRPTQAGYCLSLLKGDRSAWTTGSNAAQWAGPASLLMGFEIFFSFAETTVFGFLSEVGACSRRKEGLAVTGSAGQR